MRGGLPFQRPLCFHSQEFGSGSKTFLPFSPSCWRVTYTSKSRGIFKNENFLVLRTKVRTCLYRENTNKKQRHPESPHLREITIHTCWGISFPPFTYGRIMIQVMIQVITHRGCWYRATWFTPIRPRILHKSTRHSTVSQREAWAGGHSGATPPRRRTRSTTHKLCGLQQVG